MNCKAYTITSLAAGIAACLVACEKVNEYTGPLPDLKLVLYSFIQPDSLVRVEVKKTRYFSSETIEQPENVTGEVYINGQVAGILVKEEASPWRPVPRYVADARPRPGDRVRVVARADGLQEAWGEVTLPSGNTPVRVDSLLVRNKEKVEQARYTIHVDDKERERHYYRLVIETETYELVNGERYNSASSYSFNPENDPLLVGGNNTWLNEDVVPNRYRVFTNESFEGEGYTLRVSVAARNTYRVEYDRYGEKIVQRQVMNHRVSLVRLDEDTYLHLKSLMLLEMGQDVMEPVQVHSNVQGGVGIIGHACYSTRSFEMPEIEWAEMPYGY
ncbi:MAG: DUF4249 domain-containing protein [Odoribacteraceae bacterium]|jgi:hypothetical protein|nr:DUF4249 domain-containing protein [Odoribacteraceae bacterium]